MATKIAIVGDFWPGSLETSYADAFAATGATVHRIDHRAFAGSGSLAASRLLSRVFLRLAANAMGKSMLREVQAVAPDVVLVIKGIRYTPQTIERLRLLAGLVVNFNPDSPWERVNSNAWLRASIPIYHHHFTWNRQLIDRFTQAGATSVSYLPFAYDPDLHRPLQHSVEPVYDAVFLGTHDREREQLLASLTGVHVAIWGNGWEKNRRVSHERIKGPAVYGANAVERMALGRVNLNILRTQNSGSHNMRTFEIPACGLAMLTTRSEEQSGFFAEGQEMLCYSDADELLQKIRWAAAHSVEVRDISQRAYARVKDETYGSRAQTMFQKLGL